MKPEKSVFVDRLILIVFALLLTLPVVMIGFSSFGEKAKADAFNYYTSALMALAFFFVFKPFEKLYRWFGFKNKKPVLLGACMNGILVGLVVFIFRDGIDRTPLMLRIQGSILEMVLWVFLMRSIGFLRGKFFRRV